jgi:hypothetical protein
MDASLNMASFRALDVARKPRSIVKPHFCFACVRSRARRQACAPVWASWLKFKLLTVSATTRQPWEPIVAPAAAGGRGATTTSRSRERGFRRFQTFLPRVSTTNARAGRSSCPWALHPGRAEIGQARAGLLAVCCPPATVMRHLYNQKYDLRQFADRLATAGKGGHMGPWRPPLLHDAAAPHFVPPEGPTLSRLSFPGDYPWQHSRA